MRETLPEKYRGSFAIHEVVHVMEQLKFQLYLDFIKRTPDAMNMLHDDTQILLEECAKHCGIDLFNMADGDEVTLFDEVNATVVGSIAIGDPTLDYLRGGFHDFDAYAAELDGILQHFKQSRTGGEKFSLKGSEELTREIDRIVREGKTTGRSDTEIQADIRAAVDTVYRKMVKEYGAIKPGERAARKVEVPKRTADDKKVSQTVRTILEAGATPDAAIPNIEQLTAQGDFSYEVITDKAAMTDADAKIRDKGYQTALLEWSGDVREGKVG